MSRGVGSGRAARHAELAVRVLRAKGLDESDKVMRQTVAFRIVQAVRIAAKRGTARSAGRRKGVRVWSA
jgi:hypothetical protein